MSWSNANTGDPQPGPTEDDDAFVGTAGGDVANGLGGNDVLSGQGGNDSLVGGAGDDLLQGGFGNDTLVGGTGEDQLSGDANDDSIVDEGGGAAVNGGAGNDIIAVTVEGALWSFGVSISGDEGNDSIVASGTGLDDGFGNKIGAFINGGGGGDTIIGSDADDPTYGGDQIDGGIGDDSIIGGKGNDVIIGGGGDDTVVWRLGDGNDTIAGAAGTDTLDLEGWTLSGPNPWSVSIDGATTYYTHAPSGAVLETTGFENVLCFAEGTRILTPRGEVPVESLRAGDTVIVPRAGQRAQALRWVGHRRIDFAHLRDAAAAAPVLIRAGALGPGVPCRDLRVSPEHGLLLDGRLVPARLLVDGAAILQETWCRGVTYWHLELAEHGVLVAEGALAESYFDDGNRAFFENSNLVALDPRFEREPGGRYAKEACAPPLLDADDPALARIRARIWRRRTAA